MTIQEVNELIRTRRSIFPDVYTGGTISDEIILDILENANWAPNHKKTEPWRFQVFKGAALDRLGDFLATTYKKITPEEKFSEKKFSKILKKPGKASAVIVICMQRDPNESLPEWEETAAVAMAVQNMWLSCTAHGLGCYWGSPGMIHHAKEFLKLAEGERCLGFFFMGTHQMGTLPGNRKPIADKVKWVNE